VNDDVSKLLAELNAGNDGAFGFLVAGVYRELRRMAGAFMRNHAQGNTLQPTALVHEAYFRLLEGDSRWESKARFFGAAVRAMRQVLVTQPRGKLAQKRAGRMARVTLDEVEIHSEAPDPESSRPGQSAHG
jgi:RNA polymerase sigma factor (TIGR02999 family)